MTCSQKDLLSRKIVLGLVYTIPVVVVLVLNICLSIVEVARCWWNGVLGSRTSGHLLKYLQYFCQPNFLTFLAFPSSATVRPSSESEDFPKQFLASLPVSQYKISMKETSENPNMRPNSPPT